MYSIGYFLRCWKNGRFPQSILAENSTFLKYHMVSYVIGIQNWYVGKISVQLDQAAMKIDAWIAKLLKSSNAFLVSTAWQAVLTTFKTIIILIEYAYTCC